MLKITLKKPLWQGNCFIGGTRKKSTEIPERELDTIHRYPGELGKQDSGKNSERVSLIENLSACRSYRL